LGHALNRHFARRLGGTLEYNVFNEVAAGGCYNLTDTGYPLPLLLRFVTRNSPGQLDRQFSDHMLSASFDAVRAAVEIDAGVQN
jgi:hypothetical protein